ncbi:MAG: carbon-nitrogen family hydrolase [Clostridia bacterium]|nr:carbon-nitrogen family hydrolase [Clostridia bacterium]
MPKELKVSCIQMNMLLGQTENNFSYARKLTEKALRTEKSDVIVLPEMWNTGFFPKENLEMLADTDGNRTLELLSRLAREYNVNIVGGSVANRKNGKIYNTCFVVNRKGETVFEYDKIHLFSPMDEHKYFSHGIKSNVFMLDDIPCGVIVCYDLRFPELARGLALSGAKVLFTVSQWPKERIEQLNILSKARAVENQMYTVLCNSCACAGSTVFGGSSQIVSPLGEVLARAGESEEIISACLDLSVADSIRSTINVFNDRKPDLYNM